MTKSIRNTTPKTQEEIEVSKASIMACWMFIAEIETANSKYPAKFNGSKEALGVLREEYLEVEELLRKIKTINGKTSDLYSDIKTDELKGELVQLGAMCIKALYSLCNLERETAAFSEATDREI